MNVLYTAKRNRDEKYIGQGWYMFAKDKRLNKGEILRFIVTSPPDTLHVYRMNP